MLPCPGVRLWSFVTLVLAALAIGAPLAHALELPVRRGWDPAQYVTVTHSLYRYFAIVGGALEVGAVVAAVVWAVLLVRARPAPRAARRWALAGAAGLVLAHVLFWLLVEPANRQFAVWTPDTVPADWTRWRDQWEFTHAGRAGLFLLGYCALLASRLALSGERGATRGAGLGRGETTR